MAFAPTTATQQAVRGSESLANILESNNQRLSDIAGRLAGVRARILGSIPMAGSNTNLKEVSSVSFDTNMNRMVTEQSGYVDGLEQTLRDLESWI